MNTCLFVLLLIIGFTLAYAAVKAFFKRWADFVWFGSFMIWNLWYAIRDNSVLSGIVAAIMLFWAITSIPEDESENEEDYDCDCDEDEEDEQEEVNEARDKKKKD